ncbi:hypothetical protein NOF55_19935 [Rhizobiaceae bacterium BDR2-2]|uniref:Uncharacterized protein n=1 Tax=Ectorhizobium quercum TaxID=2965071 RepID=A0AAE3N3A9_9HYPH|nr:hypothetical protein [Ectorhizobium quercum]MCX8999381.1 hypothetical protein [Ectorhizobium quercum]
MDLDRAAVCRNLLDGSLQAFPEGLPRLSQGICSLADHLCSLIRQFIDAYYLHASKSCGINPDSTLFACRLTIL